MRKELSVSLVIYKNAKDEILTFIEQLNNIEISTKLFIIDNSPNDEFRKYIPNDSIDYIFNQNNLGYGAAHNIAIKRSIQQGYLYHLIVNPDIIFESKVLNKLFDFMQKNIDIGLCMPKVKYPDGELQYLCKLLPNPVDLFARRFLPKSLSNRTNFKYELRDSDYNKIMDVPSLSGCFMFCRTDFLKIIEGFDDRFFMYCEDIDFSRRMNEISRTVYNPEIEIIHNHAQESYKKPKMLVIHIRSAIMYFNKWGWIFDNYRNKVNKKTLINVKLSK